MTFTINKSDISEVRDQLSLDFADGKYLDAIAQNLGLHEHLFSFGDDVWRALVKLLAIEYKQVATKFVNVMDLLFGPKVTQIGTPKNPIEVGDTTFIMNNTSNLPQVGTLIFDEGLATEETLEYRYIDRTNNEVVLETEFAFAHSAWEADTETVILAIGPTGDVVYAGGERPDPSSNPPPFTVILDRGLDTEASYTATAEDVDTRTFTLSPNPYGLHSFENSTDIRTTTNTETSYFYPEGSYSLLVEDSSDFPQSGVIKIISGSAFNLSADNAGASGTTVTFPASSFVADTLAGCEVVFFGTGIGGETRRIVSNTETTIVIDRDFTGVADYPRTSDAILIHPIVPYSSNDAVNNSFNLVRPLPPNLTVGFASPVELLGDDHKVSIAPVQYKGTGWDLVQSTPRKVEIYIPEEIRDINDIRSASYLHENQPGSWISTTTSAQALVGDSYLALTSLADFPNSGTLIINEGNGNEEYVSYGVIASELKEPVSIGDTFIVLEDSSFFGSTGNITINREAGVKDVTEDFVFTTNLLVEGKLTLQAPASFDFNVGTSVSSTLFVALSSPLAFQHSASSTVSFYAPNHAGSDVSIGDINQDGNTYPGPYVYSTYGSSPSVATTAVSSLANVVPGPSFLSIDQYKSRNVLEIKGGLAMFTGLGTSLPFPAFAGRQSISVSKVSLESLVEGDLQTDYYAGSTELEINDFRFSQTDGASFPEGAGYRVILSQGNAEEEVCYVVGYVENPYPVIILESPTLYDHDNGDYVHLLSDVVTLDSPLRTNLTGLVPYELRSTAVAGAGARFPTESLQDYTAKVSPLLDCITLSSVTGWDIEGGTALLNFGESTISVKGELAVDLNQGATTMTLVNATDFPSVYPYEVVVDANIRKSVSAPYHYEETLLVTNKTGNVLTTSDISKWKHLAGSIVEFRVNPSEEVNYTSVEGSDLCFANPIVLEYTHYPAETVISSQTKSNPSTDGFDFPLRMPIDLAARLEYLIDLIRAAGIEVEIISKR